MRGFNTHPREAQLTQMTSVYLDVDTIHKNLYIEYKSEYILGFVGLSWWFPQLCATVALTTNPKQMQIYWLTNANKLH